MKRLISTASPERMKHRFPAYAQAIALVAVLIIAGSTIVTINSGKALKARLVESISGEVTSIEVRDFACCEKSWRQIQPLRTIIGAIRQAEVSLPPSHAQAKRSLVMRITTRRGEMSKRSCFVVFQYVGFEDKTYLGNVEPQDDCDGANLKWHAGVVSLPAILH